MSLIAPVVIDADATAIGRLYRKARLSIAESAQLLIEAGRRLITKKDSLPHGQWLPWLEENAEALGFGSRQTAHKLMQAAEKCRVNATFDETDAIHISRQIWGNAPASSQLIQQSTSNEHYTPAQYIVAVKAVLGDIDLDPASCAEANRTVKARKFYDEETDGLQRSWHGRVFLNPPYGDLPGPFIEKLASEIAAGNVKSAVVLVNAHCTDTIWFRPLWDGVLCFTDHRINFSGDDERSGSTHGSVFVYFGSDKQKFIAEFARFGAVVALAS